HGTDAARPWSRRLLDSLSTMHPFQHAYASDLLATFFRLDGQLDEAERAARVAHELGQTALASRIDTRGTLAQVILAKGRAADALALVGTPSKRLFALSDAEGGV